MPSWVRRCLTLIAIVAVWLVARPAAASAPLCDDRAASVLAPIPTLDAPNASLDTGDAGDAAPASCGLANGDQALQRGDKSGGSPAAPHSEVILASVVCAVAPPAYEGGLAASADSVASSGVRRFLERPPRPSF